MPIDTKTFYMLGWGVVVALGTMRVAPPLYFTPIYLFALLAAFDKGSRDSLVALAGKFPLLLAYFSFAVVSLLWAEFPEMVLKELRGNIVLPCLAFVASFHFCRTYGRQQTTEFMIAMAWGAFLAGSAIAYMVFRQQWIDEVFNGVGYYSTDIFMLAAVTLPFLNRWSRILLYPVVAILLFLTQQRVAWVVFPAIGIADLALHGRATLGKGKLALLAVIVLAFSYGMMKVVLDGKSPDAFHPGSQAGGVIDHLAQNERLTAWRQWLARGMENPVLGAGYGRDNVKAHFSGGKAWPDEWLHHGHNIFLNNFLQLGLVGLALFLAAHYQLIQYLIRRWQPFSAAALLLVIFFLLRNVFDDFGFKRLLIVYGLLFGACLANIASGSTNASGKTEPV